MEIRSGVDHKTHHVRSASDLLPSERRLTAAMYQLGFGRFESLRIEHGQIVLDPWPATVRNVKFASDDAAMARTPSDDSPLKRQVIELLEYVRAVDAGEIRCLEIRHGLPFSMEVALTGTGTTETGGDHRG